MQNNISLSQGCRDHSLGRAPRSPEKALGEHTWSREATSPPAPVSTDVWVQDKPTGDTGALGHFPGQENRLPSGTLALPSLGLAAAALPSARSPRLLGPGGAKETEFHSGAGNFSKSPMQSFTHPSIHSFIFPFIPSFHVFITKPS